MAWASIEGEKMIYGRNIVTHPPDELHRELADFFPRDFLTRYWQTEYYFIMYNLNA